MQKILRSEYEYMKLDIWICFGVVILIMLGNLFWAPIFKMNSYDNVLQIRQLFWSEISIYSFIWFTTLVIFCALVAFGSEIDKEKRERMHALLPVSLSKLSAYRLILPLFLQSGIACIWILLAVLKPGTEEPALYWTMLFGCGYVLFISYLFYIHHDLGYFNTRKYQRGMLLVLALISAFLLLIYQTFYANRDVDLLSTVITSFEGGALVFAAGLAVLYTSYVIYRKRKSFLA